MPLKPQAVSFPLDKRRTCSGFVDQFGDSYTVEAYRSAVDEFSSMPSIVCSTGSSSSSRRCRQAPREPATRSYAITWMTSRWGPEPEPGVLHDCVGTPLANVFWQETAHAFRLDPAQDPISTLCLTPRT